MKIIEILKDNVSESMKIGEGAFSEVFRITLKVEIDIESKNFKHVLIKKPQIS